MAPTVSASIRSWTIYNSLGFSTRFNVSSDESRELEWR
ncbi:predicted protein [Botrytis cinerea T4]|uniref:Uncharacterized protein n=1 Tax=Botryotinia fuckeliana (strain T4) TaxID=999810 RepID=G2XT77_BOTF4|nr:predicted protein [Botrytis cinerea T4]